jgi:hypothetical protein
MLRKEERTEFLDGSKRASSGRFTALHGRNSTDMDMRNRRRTTGVEGVIEDFRARMMIVD